MIFFWIYDAFSTLFRNMIGLLPTIIVPALPYPTPLAFIWNTLCFFFDATLLKFFIINIFAWLAVTPIWSAAKFIYKSIPLN